MRATKAPTYTLGLKTTLLADERAAVLMLSKLEIVTPIARGHSRRWLTSASPQTLASRQAKI